MPMPRIYLCMFHTVKHDLAMIIFKHVPQHDLAMIVFMHVSHSET